MLQACIYFKFMQTIKHLSMLNLLQTFRVQKEIYVQLGLFEICYSREFVIPGIYSIIKLIVSM